MVFFLAFLPVRVIHAATIGTDATTIPLFVLLLFLFDSFLSEKDSTKGDAALLGLGRAHGCLPKNCGARVLRAEARKKETSAGKTRRGVQ